MGGGGSYYDRDVTASGATSAGYTQFAEQQMARTKISQDLLPINRRLASQCKSPLAIDFDVTGSVDQLPIIFFDKCPMIAGQIVEQKYLIDPQISLSAVGDVISDMGPLQICDFSTIRDLDPWLKKIWREKMGGSQDHESYEFMAYYYAYCYDMQNAVTPIFLFIGDEFFRETIPDSQLRKHFGGEHRDADAYAVFNDLKVKFKGNVFLLHRYYARYGLNNEIVARWEKALGKGFVVNLPEDKAVADLTLGIIALASGARTLPQYIQDVRTRPLEMGGVRYKPQTEERIRLVTNALEPLENILKTRKTVAKKEGTRKAKSGKTDPEREKGQKDDFKI